MNILILVTVFILSLFISNKSLSNRVFKLFLSIWLIVIFISILNIGKLYEMSFRVFFMFFIFMFFYFLGFYAVKEKKYETISWDHFFRVFNFKGNSYLFHVTSIIFLVVISYYGYRFFNLYNNLDAISDFRMLRYEIGGLFVNGYSLALYNYVVGALIWFYKFLLAYSIVFGVGKNKVIFLYSLTICLIYYFIGGGRNIVVEILFFYILLTVVSNFVINVNKKTSVIKNTIFLFLIALFFTLGTYIRSSNEKITINLLVDTFIKSLEQIVAYITGSFRALEYALVNYDQIKYGFGIYTFSAFEEIFVNALLPLGFSYEPKNYIIGRLLSNPIPIGDGQSFNALYTGLFPFYYDFDFIGIIVFSFILGFLSKISINNFLIRKNLSSLFVFLIFSQISIFMFMSFKLNTGLMIALIFSWIISLNIKVKV
ncbi:O-antigen polymerase [Acinetobacter pseudolwoffii]|uniref:O-antigen polymerase n=1 Tax=Acinetobacter pseudolwoffii TaxID=2053287 RepID=UPI003988D832